MSRVTDAHIVARRQSILDAAVRVFSTRGVAVSTMAEIAEEAGLSAGAIYRYFESKQDLAEACFRSGAEQLVEQWRMELEVAPSPKEAFYRIAAMSFDEIVTPESRDQTRLMLEGYLELTRGDQPKVLDVTNFEHSAIIGGLAIMLSRVQAAGQLPAEIDAEALGGALCAFWMGARILRLLDPEMDVLAQLEAVRGIMDAAGPAA